MQQWLHVDSVHVCVALWGVGVCKWQCYKWHLHVCSKFTFIIHVVPKLHMCVLNSSSILRLYCEHVWLVLTTFAIVHVP